MNYRVGSVPDGTSVLLTPYGEARFTLVCPDGVDDDERRAVLDDLAEALNFARDKARWRAIPADLHAKYPFVV